MNVLSSGSTLRPGDALTSQNGRYRLELQSDGNLVVYDRNGAALWASRTAGNPGARLAIQNDGNLVIYSSGNKMVWTSGTCCR